jgi:hypothetical protein
MLVTQTGHGFRIGDVVVRANGRWVAATSDWDGVVARFLDPNRFEVVSSGEITGFTGLTPDEITYTDDGIPVYKAVSTTAVMLLPKASVAVTSATSTAAATTPTLIPHTHDDRYPLLPLAGGVLDIDEGNLVFDIETLEQVTD